MCGSITSPSQASKAQRMAWLIWSASARALVNSAAAPSRWALVRRMAFVASKPRICSASAVPSRPPQSNSRRSQLELIWMSIDGAAVAVTWPAE